MSHQDHKPQVFNFGKRPGSSGGTGSAPKKVSETQATRIMQAGGKVDIVKKQAPSNKHNGDLGRQAKHIDDDTETLRVKTVDPMIRANIQRARQQKEWTQQDLARAINEKPSVVSDYEQGKAIPNEQVLNRMEKALGVYIRGVKAGQPLEVRAPVAKASAKAPATPPPGKSPAQAPAAPAK